MPSLPAVIVVIPTQCARTGSELQSSVAGNWFGHRKLSLTSACTDININYLSRNNIIVMVMLAANAPFEDDTYNVIVAN